MPSYQLATLSKSESENDFCGACMCGAGPGAASVLAPPAIPSSFTSKKFGIVTLLRLQPTHPSTRPSPPPNAIASVSRPSYQRHTLTAHVLRPPTRDGLRPRRRRNQRALPRGTLPALLAVTCPLTQACSGQQPARQLHRPELQSRDCELAAAGDACGDPHPCHRCRRSPR
jgi:hypothetical protein